jgi:hypothetical protein
MERQLQRAALLAAAFTFTVATAGMGRFQQLRHGHRRRVSLCFSRSSYGDKRGAQRIMRQRVAAAKRLDGYTGMWEPLGIEMARNRQGNALSELF